jgi:DNA-binding transcriptional regulator YhcF (GntR family)
MQQIIEFINDEAGNKTKHRQITDGIVQAISEKVLKSGDMLPSVNAFLKKLPVARMTIVKALEELKERGIIESENRVGYFVKSGDVNQKLKVMLFLTEFNVYHEILYNKIIAELKKEKIIVDLYFHHCNPLVFKTVLKENRGLYGLYIVTPFNHTQVKKSLSEIPQKKLLQIMRPPVIEDASYICQDFYNEVLDALKSIKIQISKYKKLMLVFPDRAGHPEVIRQAFFKFCTSSGINFGEVSCITKEMVKEHHAWFVIADKDLIELVKYGEEKGLKLGESLGILSYNDTPMKEIIKNGITVISTDFAEIGLSISNFIKTRQPMQKRMPTKVTLRKSL